MNTIKIETSQNIELEYELSGLGERVVATIIDSAIIVAYVFIIFLVFVMINPKVGLQWILVTLYLPVLFYHLISELVMNGQSVGKRVMKIRVISINGQPASFGQFLIRWLFRLVDISISSCVCALICVAVTEKKQRLGDIVAGTTLIKTIPRPQFEQSLYIPVAEINYTVTYPEVINLSDRDMQLIKEVILSILKGGNPMIAWHTADKIKQILHIQSSLEPFPFLQTILSDYNYLSSIN